MHEYRRRRQDRFLAPFIPLYEVGITPLEAKVLAYRLFLLLEFVFCSSSTSKTVNFECFGPIEIAGQVNGKGVLAC